MKRPVFKLLLNFWEGDLAHQIALYSTNLVDIGGGVASGGGMTFYVIDTGTSSGSKSTSRFDRQRGTAVVVNGTPALQDQIIPMAIVSTPDQSGAVYHIVQDGQALWQIAIAYKVKINDIKTLNDLSSDVIYPGQKLLIMHAATLTPVPPTLLRHLIFPLSRRFPRLKLLRKPQPAQQRQLPRRPLKVGVERQWWVELSSLH